MKILVIGTAVLDILAMPIKHESEWQDKQRIDQINISIGGDGANQSIHLADLEHNVMLCSCVGSDINGRILSELLKDRNVSTQYLFYREDVPTGTAFVLVKEDGERNTFSVNNGAHSLLDKNHVMASLNKELNNIKAISIASLFTMPNLEQDGLMEILKKAEEREIITFADLGSDKKKQGINGIKKFLPHITYFIPSIYDIKKMTGIDSAEENAKVLLSYGCKNVIIKCGENGCYYSNKDKNGWVKTIHVEPVDTNGAGDCMVALIINYILKGMDLEEACRYSAAGATYSTLFAGASEIRITEKCIEAFINKRGI